MKRNQITTFITFGIAAVVFVCLFFFTFHSRADRHDKFEVQIVAFGDSQLGLVRDETSVLSQIGSLMDMTVFNAAFGGTCVSRIDTEHRLDYDKDALSLAALAKAVVMDDFGVQQAARFRESNTEHFEWTVDDLEAIDFSAVELVLIQHGLNDYYAGVPIRNEEDIYDEYTFTGALRSALEALRQANPNMRIVLVTPSYSWLIPAEETCEEHDGGGGVEEEYVLAEIELAEELGVEVIDVYHDVYPHEKWEDWKLYSDDGLHPNEAGRKLLADIIAGYLKQTP